MSIQTIEQLRAANALKEIQTINQNKNQKEKREFLSYANELPAMIHMNGLGQAMAFYYSKGKMHKKLYDILSIWLSTEGNIYPDKNLLKNITTNDMHTYRMAQTEAQAYLIWLKSFARAYLKEKKGV